MNIKNFNYFLKGGVRFIYFSIFYVCLFFSYGREYADPYLGHSIGPVAGYGVSSHAYCVEHVMNNDNFILLIQSFSLVSNLNLIFSIPLCLNKLKYIQPSTQQLYVADSNSP